ncbi:hypothetical protein G0Y23_03135 [Staphylococcus aureus]|nr:hypothetical protein [Staphylococcus aureus]
MNGLNSVIGAMIIIDKNATTVTMNFLIYITSININLYHR